MEETVRVRLWEAFLEAAKETSIYTQKIYVVLVNQKPLPNYFFSDKDAKKAVDVSIVERLKSLKAKKVYNNTLSRYVSSNIRPKDSDILENSPAFQTWKSNFQRVLEEEERRESSEITNDELDIGRKKLIGEYEIYSILPPIPNGV